MIKRGRLIIVLAAMTLLLAIVVLPRISQAGHFKWFSAERTASAGQVDNTPAQDQKFDITVVASYHNDTSPPLREMKPMPLFSKVQREANENPKIPHKYKDTPDTVVQNKLDMLSNTIVANMPSPTINVNGIPFPGVACNCAPPDTNGEVGATQYVQIANEGFQVFDKTTGTSVYGPVGISTLWNGFGGPCETAGSGDPVVLYDQLADRWVITQFAGVGIPTDECIAVSTSSNATGT